MAEFGSDLFGQLINFDAFGVGLVVAELVLMLEQGMPAKEAPGKMRGGA